MNIFQTLIIPRGDTHLTRHILRNNLNTSSHRYWSALLRYLDLKHHTKKVTDNAGLYHYAGNNPIRYIDPDRRRDMTADEKQFVAEILGKDAPLNTQIFQNFTDAGSYSSPLGYVLIQKSCYSDSMNTAEQLSNLTHELYHQVQYKKNKIDISFSICMEFNIGLSWTCHGLSLFDLDIIPLLNIQGSYPSLINEFAVDELLNIFSDSKIVNYVYKYGNISKYKTLSDLPYLESQASMIEDFSRDYYNYRYLNFKPIKSQKEVLKKQAQIMEASGIKSEATRWVLEDP